MLLNRLAQSTPRLCHLRKGNIVMKILHFILWMLALPLGWTQPISPSATTAVTDAVTKPVTKPVIKPVINAIDPTPQAPVAGKVNILPYATGQWKSLLQTQTHNTMVNSSANTGLANGRSGTPLVVHFWGVTCGPCLSEMPQWGRFVTDNPGYKVVFVQVDDVSTGIMSQLLAKARLGQAVNYKLTTPFDEFMRYEVDAQWRGETPFTIMVNASGQQTQLTGLVNFGKLKKWYQQNS